MVGFTGLVTKMRGVYRYFGIPVTLVYLLYRQGPLIRYSYEAIIIISAISVNQREPREPTVHYLVKFEVFDEIGFFRIEEAGRFKMSEEAQRPEAQCWAELY